MTISPHPGRTAPPADHVVSGPAAAPHGHDDEAVGATPLHAKVRLARHAEADPAGLAENKPDPRVAGLSPLVFLVLIAGALALMVVLVIFGGLT